MTTVKIRQSDSCSAKVNKKHKSGQCLLGSVWVSGCSGVTSTDLIGRLCRFAAEVSHQRRVQADGLPQSALRNSFGAQRAGEDAAQQSLSGGHVCLFFFFFFFLFYKQFVKLASEDAQSSFMSAPRSAERRAVRQLWVPCASCSLVKPQPTPAHSHTACLAASSPLLC